MEDPPAPGLECPEGFLLGVGETVDPGQHEHLVSLEPFERYSLIAQPRMPPAIDLVWYVRFFQQSRTGREPSLILTRREVERRELAPGVGRQRIDQSDVGHPIAACEQGAMLLGKAAEPGLGVVEPTAGPEAVAQGMGRPPSAQACPATVRSRQCAASGAWNNEERQSSTGRR